MERAVGVLERILAAVGAMNATLAVTEPPGTTEPLPPTDGGLALIAEASIAVGGMMDDRTAPDALRRAEALRSRLRTLADPPDPSTRDVGLLRDAS